MVVQRADTVMLSVVNSLAVIYIYKQFSSLRKAGSKYLLGEYNYKCNHVSCYSSDMVVYVLQV